MEDDGRPVSDLVGYSIYNQLGLSTQVSNIIQIRVRTYGLLSREESMPPRDANTGGARSSPGSTGVRVPVTVTLP